MKRSAHLLGVMVVLTGVVVCLGHAAPHNPMRKVRLSPESSSLPTTATGS